MVKGGFDYPVKARVAGTKAHRQYLSKVILPLRGVRNPALMQ
ncbi:hypothetical protein [Rhizobium mongolense]|uniref:Uncharacterized protein n=1 Tax=Rhizobium mongolense TaxID=57676 RepID=A0A7W6WCE3_9HYPH|nr:hypothetical protein [Rhizobium mongolense]